jgi:hypothetical protein
MHANRRSALLVVAFVAVASLGATCISINDPGVFAINLQNVTGNYAIQPGVLQFGNPPGSNSCATVNAGSYIDQNFDVIKGGRLVDIIVTTHGSFAGNVSNGQLTVNGTPLLSYGGSWNAFNTPQSSLTSALLTRNQPGVNALINAIVNQQHITLCGSGAFNQATVAGLSVDVEVFAQVDVSNN